MPGLPQQRRYVAQVGGIFPVLRDDFDHAYEPEQLPCTVHPEWWDVDAPPGDHVIAQAQCQSCPALLACAAAADVLAPHVGGVWAGVVVHLNGGGNGFG